MAGLELREAQEGVQHPTDDVDDVVSDVTGVGNANLGLPALLGDPLMIKRPLLRHVDGLFWNFLRGQALLQLYRTKHCHSFSFSNVSAQPSPRR